MARCPPANQHTAKVRTTQGNDRRASKWVIVVGDLAQLNGDLDQSPLRRNSREDEKDAANKSKK